MRQFNEGESLQNIIQTAIPGFVEAEYPVFVEFVKAFLRFLEKEREQETTTAAPEYGEAQGGTREVTTAYGGPVYEARKLLEYRDVSTTLDEFTSHFLEMFGKNFPKYSYIPADLLVRSLRQFYTRKGTADSIRWFFRAFFNRHADIYFPREDILKASDGTWSAPITLKVSSPLPDPTTGTTPENDSVGRFYTGQRIQTDTGSAQVESVVTTIVGQSYNQQIIVNELTLKFDSVLGTFEPDQTLQNIDSDEVIYTRILPVIAGVTIGSGGSNYLPGDIVTFSEGPAGGGGYGAYGEVASVASTALNGVLINDGGDGYITGITLTFTSTSGSGAAATVSRIVYGELELEDPDGPGYLLYEDGDSFDLEDKNTLTLELTIEPFVNAVATVTLDSADYGTDTGVAQMSGVTLDSAIEIALAAADEKPFMHPWVWTDALHTTAELANAAAIIQMRANAVFFANGAGLYVLSSPTDLSTNATNASIRANVIVSDTTTGNNQNKLYLKEFANLASFAVGQTVKANIEVEQAGTITTDGTTTVTGANTIFERVLSVNTHIRLSGGAEAVVKTIANNTSFTAWSTVSAASANTWSIVPVGTVLSIDPQAQRYYGKIKEITFQSSGANYQTPPAVTAESMSADVQESFYFEDSNNSILSSNGQISVYEVADLDAQQDSGQVVRVRVLGSGVNYTNEDAVVITILHGDGRTGSNAVAYPVLGALTEYPGQFTTSRGFLSSNKYLQDSVFYNDYTYVVQVAESFDRYRQLLLKLFHPAGFKAIGAFVEVDEATLATPAAVDPVVTVTP